MNNSPPNTDTGMGMHQEHLFAPIDTPRSRPFKEHDTVRLRRISGALSGILAKQARPIRIARWSTDWRTGRGRLLRGQASQSKTPLGRRWRLVLRLKRRVSTWYRRREL